MRVGTPHMKVLPGHELLIQSESGMAHFAGTGPANTTCRMCKHWVKNGSVKRDPEGGLRPRQCDKFTKMVGRQGDAISHDAVSCKYYLGTKRYPKIEKRVRKVREQAIL